MNTGELSWFKSSYSSGGGGECVEVAMTWRRSKYSDGGGGECVEVALPWHKSTHSGGEGGDCVEVATSATAVHVRDSKTAPDGGPHLTLSPAAWASFLPHAPRLG